MQAEALSIMQTWILLAVISLGVLVLAIGVSVIRSQLIVSHVIKTLRASAEGSPWPLADEDQAEVTRTGDISVYRMQGYLSSGAGERTSGYLVFGFDEAALCLFYSGPISTHVEMVPRSSTKYLQVRRGTINWSIGASGRKFKVNMIRGLGKQVCSELAVAGWPIEPMQR